MKLLDRALAFAGLERRSTDEYTRKHLATRAARVGFGSTPASPEALPMLYSCVNVIAETTASIPLSLTDRTTREVAEDHPLHRVLHTEWNPHMTALEGREHLVASCALTGNGYARTERRNDGAVVALYPIMPGMVGVDRLSNGRLRYRYTDENGRTSTLLDDEVLHVRYRSADGIVGRSPVEVARPLFELSAQQQHFQIRHLENMGRPSGAVRLPTGNSLDDEAFERLKTEINSMVDSGRMPLFEDGLEYINLAITPRDAEFVDTMKLTNLDICRIYRVPPTSVGITDNATYSNVAQEQAALVKHCLRPWMVRIEQAMTHALLTPQGRRRYSVEHNAEGLLRGSQEERFEAYRIAREWGWMNVNEIRQRESMPGIGAAGDEYRSPMNSEPLANGGDQA